MNSVISYVATERKSNAGPKQRKFEPEKLPEKKKTVVERKSEEMMLLII